MLLARDELKAVKSKVCDERIEGQYFIIEINGRLGDLTISLTQEGEKEIDSRLDDLYEDDEIRRHYENGDALDPCNHIFYGMLLDDKKLNNDDRAFKVLHRDAVPGFPYMPIVSDDFDEADDGKAVRVGRAWYPDDPQSDERGLAEALDEDGSVDFYLITGFERFPDAEAPHNNDE